MAEIYGERWSIVKSLPEGGQAHTFLVKDIKNMQADDSKRYVLKRLKNLDRIGRFTQEIEAIKNLNHPNILPLIDYDITSKKPYFVSPCAEGGSLADHEGKYTNNPIEALKIIIAILNGLAFAHQHDPMIIHRDIKPANIFLFGPDFQPLIGDFGICHVEDGNRLTLTDEAVGSRLFCPPELEDGRADQVKPSSDIYSLGKLLYWLLAGRVFAREQHRDPNWNLIKMFSNSKYEHINKLLDKMVVEHQDKRYPDAATTVEMANYVMNLLRKDARAIFPGAPLECGFCKQGNYKTINLDNNVRVHNFGLSAVGGAQWHALICETCGNLQLFRLEEATAKSVFWGK